MASALAVELDVEMLHQRHATIYETNVPDDLMAERPGAVAAEELGRRYVLRYVLPMQMGIFTGGSSFRTYVTPTPIRPEHTVQFLALPLPTNGRSHVLVLDLSKVDAVCGPRRIKLGQGIEYVLPKGFPERALVVNWEIEIK